MPGYNASLITPDVLRNMQLSEAHQRVIDSFIAQQIVLGPYWNEVEVDKGIFPVFKETDDGSVAIDDVNRTTFVANGAPTPKGNLQTIDVTYICEEQRLGVPLTKRSHKNLDAYFSDVSGTALAQAMTRVMSDRDKRLANILRNGSSVAFTQGTNQALTGREWNNYASATHDPVKDLRDMMTLTGANKLALGQNVAYALSRSPVLTGSTAGSGDNFLTVASLIEVLQSLGFIEVVIGNVRNHVGSQSLPLSLGDIWNGTAAMWSDGAIHAFEHEALHYDTFEDHDRKTTFYRANTSVCFRIPRAGEVGTFTAVLT